VLDPYLTRAQGIALISGDTLLIADGGRTSPSGLLEPSGTARIPAGFTSARIFDPPILNHRFKQLFAGGRVTCGQSFDSSNPQMRCWGENGDWQLAGNPKALGVAAVGKNHVCYQVRVKTASDRL
jgi:hypothetical protein